MRKIFRQIFSFWNIIFFLAMVWVFYKKAPTWISQYKTEGTVASSVAVTTFDGKSINLPHPNKKQVLVFWATWCAPCGVELVRLNRLIENGTVAADSIVAISIMEDAKLVKDTIHERGYQFKVYLDLNGSASEAYKVEGTPTILLIDEDGKISWMTTGLSPTLEYRVKKFFKE